VRDGSRAQVRKMRLDKGKNGGHGTAATWGNEVGLEMVPQLNPCNKRRDSRSDRVTGSIAACNFTVKALPASI
jgi:hypothetical protein